MASPDPPGGCEQTCRAYGQLQGPRSAGEGGWSAKDLGLIQRCGCAWGHGGGDRRTGVQPPAAPEFAHAHYRARTSSVWAVWWVQNPVISGGQQRGGRGVGWRVG